MTDLSIIIINYKTPDLILACVASIYQYIKQLRFEIVVVNNASLANDKEIILAAFPQIQWLETGYNAGFGRANNVGMKAAKGEYLLLLNSDTLLIDDSVEKAYQRLRNSQQIAAVGAVQLNPDGSGKPTFHAFAPILRYSWLVFPHPAADAWLERLIPNKTYPQPEQVDYISGSFFMVSKANFQRTGGFDENLFMYAEDCDWSARLSPYGKLLLLSDCRYIHDEWGSSPERRRQLPERTFFNRFDTQAQLSNLYFIRKHYGSLYYVALMLHYWLWIPLFFLLKLATNIRQFKNPFVGYAAQRKFAGTIITFSRYFFSILLNRPRFLKIK